MNIPQGDDEWHSPQKKYTKGENPKNTSVCETHYSKYQLIKIMYKTITSLFLQKPLEADCNSGIHPKQKFLKRVPYNGQF